MTERLITIKSIRETGKLPHNFIEKHKHEAEIAKKLLARDPSERPTIN